MFLSRLFRCCLLVVLSAVVFQTVAQDFSDLEERLLEHPSLQQLNFEALASREQATAATALPDPELSLGINNVPLANPSFDRFLPSNKAVGILQQFPNRAGRNARSAKMRESADQIDTHKRALYAELRGQLLAELIQLNLITELRSLALARNAQYDELVDVAEAEINAGRPVLYRLAEIERERTDVARTLVELRGEAARIEASIIEKVGPVKKMPVSTVSATTWNRDPRQFHAVRVAAHLPAIADESVKEAQAQWRTHWGLNVRYQQRSSGRGGADATFRGDDWFSVGVNFSVPVWGKRKQAPNVRAAQAHRSSALANVRAVEQRSVAQYESLQAAHRTALESKEVLLDKIAAIRSEIDAQQRNYESGSGDYAPIIDGELVLLSLRAQIATEEARALSSTVLSNALLVTP